jgi:hypothetical protein
VLGGAHNWRARAHLALWLLELDGVYELATLVALIAPRVIERAKRTRALHKSIGQKSKLHKKQISNQFGLLSNIFRICCSLGTLFAIQLLNLVSGNEVVVVQLVENVL